MAFEMALKKGKPMIMSDEDFKHYNTMFTAGFDEVRRFKNSRQACSTIIEGSYMSDVHIDFSHPTCGTEMIGCMLDNYATYKEFPVYNARSKDLYDVVLKMTEFPDGTVAVRLVRPPSINYDNARAMSKLT